MSVKTIEILSVMTKSELKLFEKKVINSHKRVTLKKLYSYLKKQPKIDKEAAFLKVFNTPYTSKKDAIFRNELRLLNRELELFIVEQAWKKGLSINSDETQLSLIKLYLERKEFNLFEQTWKKLYKKSKEEGLFSLKVKLIELFFSYKTTSSEIDMDVYCAIKLLLEEAMEATVAQMQVDYKELELKHAYIQRNLYVLNGHKYDFHRAKTYYRVVNPVPNDDMIALMEYNIQSYFLDGLEKIRVLQKALKQAELLEEQHPKLRASIPMMKMTIGLEYFLLKEHSKADVIYVSALKNVAVLHPAQKSMVYFNYISNLVCLGDYQRAIEWYENSGEDWKDSPLVTYRVGWVLCWAYIMIGDYEKPMDILLEHNIQQRPENDFIYARVLLTILYYSRGELELAEREAYNIIQNDRYKLAKEVAFIQYSKLIYQHLRAAYIADKDKRRTKLQEIQKELDKMYETKLTYTSTMLHRWLTKQNEQVAAKKII